jgi:hypothetical protein
MASFLRDFIQGGAEVLPNTIRHFKQKRQADEELRLRGQRIKVEEETNRIREQQIQSINQTRQQQRDLETLKIVNDIMKLPAPMIGSQLDMMFDNDMISKEKRDFLKKIPVETWQMIGEGMADGIIDPDETARFVSRGVPTESIAFINDSLKAQRNNALHQKFFNTSGGGQKNQTEQTPVPRPQPQPRVSTQPTPQLRTPSLNQMFNHSSQGVQQPQQTPQVPQGQPQGQQPIQRPQGGVDPSKLTLQGKKNLLQYLMVNRPEERELIEQTKKDIEFFERETVEDKLLRSRMQGVGETEQQADTIEATTKELQPLVDNIFTSFTLKGRVVDSFRNLVGKVTQKTARDRDLVLYQELRDAVIAQFARIISGEKGVLTDRDRAFAEGLFPREFGFLGIQEDRRVSDKKMEFLGKNLERLRERVLSRKGIKPKGTLASAFKNLPTETETNKDITPEMALEVLKRRGVIK